MCCGIIQINCGVKKAYYPNKVIRIKSVLSVLNGPWIGSNHYLDALFLFPGSINEFLRSYNVMYSKSKKVMAFSWYKILGLRLHNPYEFSL